MNDNPKGLSDLELLGASQRNVMFLREENDRLEAENKALREELEGERDAGREKEQDYFELQAEVQALRTRVVVVPDEREAFDAAYQQLCDEGWKDVHRACWWIWKARARLNGKTVSVSLLEALLDGDSNITG